MKPHRFAVILGTVLLLALAGLLMVTSEARGATGCTCPTGCSTVTQITAPFNYSGVGEYCWSSTELGAYIQSWGTDAVQVTGVDYTNLYAVTDQMLRDTTGTYYVYYKSTTANGNFSAVGSSGITGCHKAWCSAAQYGSMLFSPFTMYNNVWGASTGQGQTIQANGPGDWLATANFPETSGVKSYPNASLDLNGKTISTLGSCTSSFNVSVPSSGSWETAYDLWVPSEVMIWVNQNGLVGPIAQGWNDDGTPIPSATNVTVGGHTWDVYHGGANVVSFLRQGDINSGTVDILAILNWIADQGWISRTSNLGKFQFGFEITSAPGGLTFTTNSYSISCGGMGGGGGGGTPPTPTRTATRTATGSTPTRTATRTNTATGATPTRTNTATRTATRSNTPTGATPTRSSTPSRTPTRSNTPTGTTPTRTPTGGTGQTCSPVSATITAPFTYDGSGTFCWQASNLGTFINSWNLASLTVNGVNYTNLYAFTSNLPAKINGYWYISYTGSYPWSHFEAK